MSDGSVRQSRPASRQRSIYRVHYGLQKSQEEVMACPVKRPFHEADVVAYNRQVAGHMKTENEKYLGVLQCSNGTILKPLIKESQKREVDFYDRVTSSTNPDLVELRHHTAAYYGTTKFTYNGYEQDYIVLGDLAYRMLEPCIMDIKIGKRTWDPFASEEKKKREESKYVKCKQEYGFCIPGFQVYNVSTGKLSRYNKDYGKKLHGQAVINALRNFLNGNGTPLCRALILQFLSQLWRIQQWAAKQTSVTLYSASLLLVYDTAKLRDCCFSTEDSVLSSKCRSWRRRRNSVHADSGSTFSGQLSANGPVYKKVNSVPITPMSLAQTSFSPPSSISSPWSEALERLNHNHSFDHNYEDKLIKMKMNYRALLDQLSGDSPHPSPWGTVKIIDFAHAFFREEGEEKKTDENFKEGIESLVRVFEQFLRETDDQVL